MIFNEHSNLEGKHAFLGASKYHWINYDPEKLEAVYSRWFATEQGTRLHAFAAEAIRLRQPLARTEQTLNRFVNDAIRFDMTPEQPLYYSDNCFGTADAICFNRNLLRVHDLKTGVTPASFHQLEIYNAIFCLEYQKDPHKIRIENRIYQSNEVQEDSPDPQWIADIMDRILDFDKRIDILKSGA